MLDGKFTAGSLAEFNQGRSKLVAAIVVHKRVPNILKYSYHLTRVRLRLMLMHSREEHQICTW